MAVVTGANSGIGYVTARELARHGAHVVLACRDPDRGRTALARMRSEVPDGRLELRQVDLASLVSIRAFTAGWDHDRLDLLINNAGVAMVPYALTTDGFESQFGINHLGTFALTGLLLPHLLAAAEPRVVTVSSEGQRFARFDLDNLNAERGYRTAFAYVQSKRANLYFAIELQRLSDAAGLPLRSMAVAPGLTRTNVLTGGANSDRGRIYTTATRMLVRAAFRPPAEGAKTSLHAATAPDLPGGSYIVPDGSSNCAANRPAGPANAPSATPTTPRAYGNSPSTSPASATPSPSHDNRPVRDHSVNPGVEHWGKPLR